MIVKREGGAYESSPQKFLHLAASAAALPAVSRMARAQAYPSRPVRMIVPFGSAGASALSRASWVNGYQSDWANNSSLKTDRAPAAIRHRGGRAGTPDGYTLVMVGQPNAINATLYDKLSFSFISDVAPVAGVIRFPNVMNVTPSVPAKTVPSSSPTPRPIQARSTWRHPELEARLI